jgi:cation/acetate symporter
VRLFAALGTLVVVAVLPDRADGRRRAADQAAVRPALRIAVVIVGALMMVYVLFGGMTATTWVQIIKAALLLGGATFMAFMVLAQFGFSPEAMFAKRRRGEDRHRGGRRASAADAARAGHLDHGPGQFHQGSDLGDLVRHGADVRHRRPAAHPDALLHRAQRQGSAQVGAVGDGLDRLFLHADLHHRLRRDRAGATNPQFLDAKGGALLGGGNMAAIHLANAVGGNVFLGFISAVAFATILAVVAGLTLSGASAVSTTSTRP